MRYGAAILGLFALLALALAAPPATLASGGQDAADAGAPPPASFTAPDWLHALQLIADLRAQPPRAPLILIIGDSTAREATISDASLTAAIGRLSGRKVVAHNIASNSQLFAQDVALVPFIPHRQTIVFIGVDVVRFSQAAATVTVKLPLPGSIQRFRQHRYRVSSVLSLSQKRANVETWLREGLPAFEAYYQDDLATLEQEVAACKARGLYPVLLNTPRNTAVIGDKWSAPVETYVAGCAALAAKYDIPFVNFVGRAHFAAGDFYDLIHAVEPGRARFQPLLCVRAARLLARYFPAK